MYMEIQVRLEEPRYLKKKKILITKLVFTDFESYYKVTVIKTLWYWPNNRHVNQGHRLESPELNTYIHSQLPSIQSIYNQLQTQKCQGDSLIVLLRNGPGAIGYLHTKR